MQRIMFIGVTCVGLFRLPRTAGPDLSKGSERLAESVRPQGPVNHGQRFSYPTPLQYMTKARYRKEAIRLGLDSPPEAVLL